jgi:hypothetical protein
MKRFLSVPSFLLGAAVLAGAAVPPPEQLLPADTMAVLTVPDWGKARATARQSAELQLWNDPAMQPFREKVTKKFKDDFVTPLEREFGVKVSDYADLAQGQITLAFSAAGWQGKEGQFPGVTLLIDSRDQKERLKRNLAELKKKWLDSGKPIKTDKVRDVEFTTILIDPKELDRTLARAFPGGGEKDAEQPGEDADAKEPAKKWELTLGQSDALLIAGTDPRTIEKILVRQSGGSLPALADEAAFQANQRAVFREALGYLWVNWKPVYQALTHRDEDEPPPPPGMPTLPPADKALPALGLSEVQTLAYSVSTSSEGTLFEFFLGVPEASRHGLFKILQAEAREAVAPPFVPADAVKFFRWRLDGQKAWAELDGLMTKLVPQWGGAIKLLLETASQGKEPDFVKKSLVGTLGNDLISFQKPPRSNALPDLASPPSMFLLGTLNGEQWIQGLRMLAAIAPPPLNQLEEREFLGRKIYSAALPPGQGPDGKPVERKFNFAVHAGYVAMTSDTALLEDYLRSGENPGKALRDAAGLAEAAQKVGGVNTGLFGFENHLETMRASWDAVKADPALFEKLNSVPPGVGRATEREMEQGIRAWLDFSLLPTFDQVAKYFHFSVWAGNANAEGVSFKMFMPLPPQLKK